MIQSKDNERLKEIAEQASKNNGCILYDLNVSQHVKNRRLRVFIDRDEDSEQGGATIKDCENVSRALSLLLDVEDIVQGGAYDLEVSTPGLERALTQDWHFEKALGEDVKLKTSSFVTPEGTTKGKVKSLAGCLKEADPEQVVIENEKGTWRIERSNIQKIQVQFSLDKNQKRNKPKKRNK